MRYVCINLLRRRRYNTSSQGFGNANADVLPVDPIH